MNELNYYKIVAELREFEERIDKIKSFKDVTLLQIQVLSYIFSQEILKSFFITQVNDFLDVLDDESYKQIIEKISQRFKPTNMDKKTNPFVFMYEYSKKNAANVLYFPVFNINQHEKIKSAIGIYNFYIVNFSGFFNFFVNDDIDREIFEKLDFYLLTLKAFRAYDLNEEAKGSEEAFNICWFLSAIKSVLLKLQCFIYMKTDDYYKKSYKIRRERNRIVEFLSDNEDKKYYSIVKLLATKPELKKDVIIEQLNIVGRDKQTPSIDALNGILKNICKFINPNGKAFSKKQLSRYIKEYGLENL